MPFFHVAVCCKGPKNKDQMSHVLNKYEREDFLLRDKATMSGYRLDPTRLLNNDPDFMEKLNKMYQKEGKNALTEIQTMYQEIQNSIHFKSGDRFEDLANDVQRRHISGLAELFKWLHKGKEQKEQFANTYQKIMRGNDFNNTKMICSEFATKSLIAGLIEEEDRIFNKMLDYLVTEEGMTTSEARTYLAEIKIFKLPFKENEKLSRVNPTRLLKLLAKHGCITRVAPNPLLQGLIKAKDLKMPHSEKGIQIPTISGYTSDETRLEKMKPNTYHSPVGDNAPPRTLPDNPTIADKWSNMDKAIFKNQLRILEHQKGGLYPLIRERRDQIKALKEEWRSKIALMPPSKLREEVARLQDKGELKPLSGGMGGAYQLLDENGIPVFIIKPSDEDILALNNRKVLATPFAGTNSQQRVRKGIPLYTTVQTEVLAYKVAEQLNFTNITPKTDMIILTNNNFHDITDNTQEMKGENKEQFLAWIGQPDREKFCSVQEFIPDSEELFDFMQGIEKKLVENDLTEDQQYDLLEKALDQKDVEDCVLFNCIIGETDGNLGNFRVYLKSEENGIKKYGIKKIDNALSFSEGNTEFSNCFSVLPHMQQRLSVEGKLRLLNLPTENIIQSMKEYGKSEKAIQAFRERIILLKQLAGKENITLSEIDESIEKMQDIRQVKLDKLKAQAARRAKAAEKTQLEESNEGYDSLVFKPNVEENYGSLVFKPDAEENYGSLVFKPHAEDNSFSLLSQFEEEDHNSLIFRFNMDEENDDPLNLEEDYSEKLNQE
jgi:hypothetical protein